MPQKNEVKLLVVDDDINIGKGIKTFFENSIIPNAFFTVTFIESELKAIEFYKKNQIDIVILDYQLKNMNGIDILKKMKSINPLPPIILLTAHGSSEVTVKALSCGAYDFLNKPFDFRDLSKIVLHAFDKISHQLKEKELETSHHASRTDSAELNFIGKNIQIKEILKIISDISSTECNVLIQGESGTGKELIARMIHQQSLRKKELFFPINCGAIPENLLESELFGYEKGAFTGAVANKLGLFEIASKGTLFLDEIGDLPHSFQVKLLRVLESGEFNHVGGTKILKTNARILAATNKDLKAAVDDGTFRRDLYYRLNVINFYLPQLRERKDDIPELVNFFIHKLSKKNNKPIQEITKEAMNFLVQYDWPGNVRELQNLIDRVTILTPGDIILPEIIARNLGSQSINRITAEKTEGSLFINLVKKDELITINELESRYIAHVLKQTKFNKIKTSQILDISERTLYRKIKEYNLENDEA
ncbi:MAG TPA: hypothetical protein DHW82_11740 [Spirochaetia bacterium]|nr:MAG: hypothetical protein A2Y41_08930 [Spirochaetes bacterium GWB1_36_13]HCL57663.1 hypothetical protein [Spirochaetia bacterium]